MSRTEKILSYRPLVEQIARTFIPVLQSHPSSPLTLDDLIQEGYLGLIDAIDRHEAPTARIRKAILAALHRHANAVSRPDHCHDEIFTDSLDRVLYRDDNDPVTLQEVIPVYDNPFTQLTQAERDAAVRKAFSQLPVREQAILSDYYGMESEEVTTEELAARYHLSSDRIKKIRQKAIKSLRRATRF